MKHLENASLPLSSFVPFRAVSVLNCWGSHSYRGRVGAHFLCDWLRSFITALMKNILGQKSSIGFGASMAQDKIFPFGINPNLFSNVTTEAPIITLDGCYFFL